MSHSKQREEEDERDRFNGTKLVSGLTKSRRFGILTDTREVTMMHPCVSVQYKLKQFDAAAPGNRTVLERETRFDGTSVRSIRIGGRAFRIAPSENDQPPQTILTCPIITLSFHFSVLL